jgi:hypothetical protein
MASESATIVKHRCDCFTEVNEPPQKNTCPNLAQYPDEPCECKQCTLEHIRWSQSVNECYYDESLCTVHYHNPRRRESHDMQDRCYEYACELYKLTKVSHGYSIYDLHIVLTLELTKFATIEKVNRAIGFIFPESERVSRICLWIGRNARLRVKMPSSTPGESFDEIVIDSTISSDDE